MFDRVLNLSLVVADQNILQKANVLVQSKTKLFYVLDYFVNTAVNLFWVIYISACAN